MDVVSRRSYEATELEERRENLKNWWGDFLRRILPDIVEKFEPAVLRTGAPRGAQELQHVASITVDDVDR
jgi:hypothetical protein